MNHAFSLVDGEWLCRYCGKPWPGGWEPFGFDAERSQTAAEECPDAVLMEGTEK